MTRHTIAHAVMVVPTVHRHGKIRPIAWRGAMPLIRRVNVKGSIMRKVVLLGLLFLLGPVLAQAPSALEGVYRVPGECAYRTDDGEYENCVAWNTLKLEPAGADRYAYTLETSTFATTAGGCASAGVLQRQVEDGRTLLRGADADDQTCRITLQVTATGIDLVEPPPNTKGCQQLCGMNSSLYTDAFPLASRRSLASNSAATAAVSASRDLEASFLDAWPPQTYQACLDGANANADTRRACRKTELTAQDARLNRVYKALLQHLPADGKHRLRDEERDWLGKTETTCARDSAALASAGLDAQTCRLNRTINRAEELQVLLDDAMKQAG